MSTVEASGFCPMCKRNVLARKRGVNHVLHVLLVPACGVGVITWILAALFSWLGSYRCTACGAKART